MYSDLLLERKCSGSQMKLLHRRSLAESQGPIPREIGRNHDSIGSDGGVSTLMVRMIMRVHDVLDRQRRDPADAPQQFTGLNLVQAGVNNQNRFLPNQKRGVRARIVV